MSGASPIAKNCTALSSAALALPFALSMGRKNELGIGGD